MSASYVRAKFREWIGQESTATGIAVYDTINYEQTPTEDVYLTYAFTAEVMEGTFCQPGYVEAGFISLVAVAAPGQGDADAVSALETMVPALFAKIDPTQRLVLTSYEAIEEATGGSADKDYRLRVLFNYRHSL